MWGVGCSHIPSDSYKKTQPRCVAPGEPSLNRAGAGQPHGATRNGGSVGCSVSSWWQLWALCEATYGPLLLLLCCGTGPCTQTLEFPLQVLVTEPHPAVLRAPQGPHLTPTLSLAGQCAG